MLTQVVREFWEEIQSKNRFYSALFIPYDVSHEYWALGPVPNIHFVVSLVKCVSASSVVHAMCWNECEILLSCDQAAFHTTLTQT